MNNISEQIKKDLNSILWKNLDIQAENTRPMLPKLQEDLEEFVSQNKHSPIHSVIELMEARIELIKKNPLPLENVDKYIIANFQDLISHLKTVQEEIKK